MKLKLDENLDLELGDRLNAAGHEASTVQGQGLRGVMDQALYRLCKEEGRTLVTLDMDFSNVLRYPPYLGPGIVVLRGHNNLLGTTRSLIDGLVAALAYQSPYGRLWIIEPGRLRVHEQG